MSEPRGINPWLALITGVIVGAIGWSLLLNLLGEWPISPDRDLRLLFFAFFWLALSGTALPLVWLLHRRFGSPDAGESWRSFGVLVRQALWVGTWFTAGAWLQMYRTLNWAMALLLLVVFVLLEMLLLTRRESEQEH